MPCAVASGEDYRRHTIVVLTLRVRSWSLTRSVRTTIRRRHTACACYSRSLLRRVGLLQQLVHGLVQILACDVLEADHALLIEHVHGRPTADVPRPGDRPVRPLIAVPERRPGHLLLLHRLL